MLNMKAALSQYCFFPFGLMQNWPPRLLVQSVSRPHGHSPLCCATIFCLSALLSPCRHFLAFSCKRRGFCPSCGAKRMSETAAYLVDYVIPSVPVRQWVLSLPIALRVLLAGKRLRITALSKWSNSWILVSTSFEVDTTWECRCKSRLIRI
jgi:Transposase zinc-binding domain